MIDVSDIKSQDILNVRDYGKCTVIQVDHNGNNNPFKRTAFLVKTKDNKQKWIAPERVINKDNEHDSNSSNVINGEASLWAAKFDNLGENKNTMKKIQIKQSNLQKYIREQAIKILNEQSKKQINEQANFNPKSAAFEVEEIKEKLEEFMMHIDMSLADTPNYDNYSKILNNYFKNIDSSLDKLINFVKRIKV